MSLVRLGEGDVIVKPHPEVCASFSTFVRTALAWDKSLGKLPKLASSSPASSDPLEETLKVTKSRDKKMNPEPLLWFQNGGAFLDSC